jgi:hypothetical protein
MLFSLTAYQHGLSAVEQYFSLTANQPQPAYKPKKKQPAEQGHGKLISTICLFNFGTDSWFCGLD